MKRLIALVTSLAMSVSALTACGSSDSSSQADKAASSPQIISRETIKGASVLAGLGAAVLIPSMVGYVSKSKLKSANSNAKMLFTTVMAEMADLVSEGNTGEISGCSAGRVVKLSELDPSNKIDAAILSNLGSTDKDPEIYFEIDTDTYTVPFAQWRADANSTVGQYPQPNTDAKNSYSIGVQNNY